MSDSGIWWWINLVPGVPLFALPSTVTFHFFHAAEISAADRADVVTCLCPEVILLLDIVVVAGLTTAVCLPSHGIGCFHLSISIEDDFIVVCSG